MPWNAPPFARDEEYLKPVDSWLDILLLDHIEVHVVDKLAKSAISPTAVTWMSILLRCLAVAGFAAHELIWGASLYFFGLVLDGVDGKLARAKQRFSGFGATLDFSADFALFSALWLALGKTASVPEIVMLLGLSAAIGSVLTTAIAPSVSEKSRIVTDGRRALVTAPGALEAHFLAFFVAPLIGNAAVTLAFIAASAHAFVGWISKLLRLAKA